MNRCQQVRRPLVGLALSMAAGLALQHVFKMPALPLLGISACVLSLMAGTQRFRTSAGLYAAVFMLATAYGAVESSRTPARAALSLAEVLSSRQTIAGRVSDDPVVYKTDRAVVFHLETATVRFEDGWRRADSSVRVRLSGLSRVPSCGERWRICGRFRSYDPAFNGLDGALYGDCTNAVCLQQAAPSFRRACYAMRHRAAGALRQGMDDFPQQAGLLQALLLGYRHELPEELHQLFARTGTLHIFAISGLHVGVMAAILIAVLKVAGVSRPRWGLFLIPLLFFYVVSTGMKPSAFRAFTMAAVYFSAPLFHRRSDTPSAIALAALILLAINPLQLSSPGFLLSFTVVCGIVMVHAFYARRIDALRLSGRSVWFRVSGRAPFAFLGRYVGFLALTSVAAWLFSVPLTARFFNTLSPVASIGNLLVIPLTFLVVLTGCLSLLAAPVSLAATGVFNHASRVFITFLISVIQRLGELPGAVRHLRAPSVWGVVCWYAGLAAIFAGPRRARRIGLALVLCAVGLWGVGQTVWRKGAGLEVYRDTDVCVLLQQDSAPQALVVQGDAYGLTRAARFLKKRGVNRCPVIAVCGSRVDVDSLQELCREFSVGHVWMGTSAAGSAAWSNDFQVAVSNRLVIPAGQGTVTLQLSQ